jgi:hypothetical protein
VARRRGDANPQPIEAPLNSIALPNDRVHAGQAIDADVTVKIDNVRKAKPGIIRRLTKP